MAGIITALEVQKHNKERVSIYLDGEFAFGLSLLEAAQLRKGQQLSDEQIAALKSRDSIEQAYESAVRFLAHRPRSTAEIRRNLKEKEIAPPIIDEVIERLEGRGYVDDLSFARYWVSNRQQFKPRGSRALRFELREKGIPDPIIDEVLTDLDTTDAAYQAALPKARRFSGLDKRAFREKLGAYLMRRGFDYDTVRETTDRLYSELQDADGTLTDDTEEYEPNDRNINPDNFAAD
jgi:regulatory protein